jgi:uncharacterized protein (TIGR03435 family)
MSRYLPAGGFTAVNQTLRSLIINAYRLQTSQLVDAPSWIDDERYDIEASPAQATPAEQATLMLRARLADRFNLRTHTDRRELPIYALVPLRAGGRLGPGLRRRRLKNAHEWRKCRLRQTAPFAVAQFGTPRGS